MSSGSDSPAGNSVMGSSICSEFAATPRHYLAHDAGGRQSLWPPALRNRQS
jgi:hypothetical protein